MRSFEHTISKVTVAAGPSFHRGRDQILSVGDAQWVIGKMTYSYADKDLRDEEVDVFVERGCGGTWEQLGTTKTTKDGDHATVEGVVDSGGRVYFEIPKAKELGAGRHRVRLVVAGDQTFTDVRIDVLPKGSPVVVSDVDGTLTASETAEFPALLQGDLPAAHPKAAEALSALAAKGYRVVYLTARPEFLTGRTHDFLDVSGFPPGIVHTTTGMTGALGEAAATFKSDELAALAAHGHKIEWAFGNKESDTEAYEAAKVPREQRVFLKVSDTHGGRRIEAYEEILPAISALPATCK
jgi:phosphatidate phosphatase APP1